MTSPRCTGRTAVPRPGGGENRQHGVLWRAAGSPRRHDQPDGIRARAGARGPGGGCRHFRRRHGPQTDPRRKSVDRRHRPRPGNGAQCGARHQCLYRHAVARPEENLHGDQLFPGGDGAAGRKRKNHPAGRTGIVGYRQDHVLAAPGCVRPADCRIHGTRDRRRPGAVAALGGAGRRSASAASIRNWAMWHSRNHGTARSP